MWTAPHIPTANRQSAFDNLIVYLPGNRLTVPRGTARVDFEGSARNYAPADGSNFLLAARVARVQEGAKFVELIR